ncbi:fatty acyl-AMP ligase [Mycolicibacter arupensis]|uniref:Fatty-acid--CoA ligase n=1 Tax=Mycolicibacter arupensis TaxID=342002 RepID=A0A0F5MRS7_9MYCO|nr:fatty acyl-AMP ligase [Mycolicibacter arupensis]KKB97294.1 fatty-acid--CoA ligase [Mycolicibacter arupensis]MCV7275938.1 fatty acyl-AMP ligase [Mycolicibacter arupensis]ORA00345.1 fatty-acid--CoA ligase [Mycolicibacter arupensis]
MDFTPTVTHPTAQTLVELLGRQAARLGDKVAFSFSYNGDDEGRSELSFRELDRRARAIAANLQRYEVAGERVLVLVRPGLDFIAGFFGCLYAGAVAVPVHQKLAPRLAVVVPDAQARFALTAAETREATRAAVAGIPGEPEQWFFTDAGADPDAWVAPDIATDSPAAIQYTSGSTRSPKGVLLTHGNILHNVDAIRQAWNGNEEARGVFWLPPHHDLGLIGGILSMVYIGASTALMSPTAFIKRPMRWLELVSAHRGVITAAPNFAYDRCVETSTPEERAALDLSCLTVAMNGAESVRATSLAAFADAFAPAGFQLSSCYPVYGLAEATLQVSAGCPTGMPGVRYLDRVALEQDRIVDVSPDDPAAATFVGCGQPRQADLVIVDPVTRKPCDSDQIGEIWVAGPNVAQGYWQRPEETAQAFGAILAEPGDPNRGPFLRTGDLGFLCAGEIFTTGRCKDLVEIDGHRYYPNDIEFTVQECDPILVSGRGAVFATDAPPGGVEELVVVHEVDSARTAETDLDAVIEAIRLAVATHHGIAPDAIVLVYHVSLPTTSSGKIQRGLTKQHFYEGRLSTITHWRMPTRELTQEELESAAKIVAQLQSWGARQG